LNLDLEAKCQLSGFIYIFHNIIYLWINQEFW